MNFMKIINQTKLNIVRGVFVSASENAGGEGETPGSDQRVLSLYRRKVMNANEKTQKT